MTNKTIKNMEECWKNMEENWKNNPPAKLSLTMNGKSVEFTWPDSDMTIDDILDVMSGLLISQTFYPETIEHGMKIYLEDHGYTVSKDKE